MHARIAALLPELPSKRVGLALLLIAVASVLLRIPFNDVPMINDEGSYAFVAAKWDGEHQLYRDIPFDRPQLLFVIYKGILAIFGGGVGAIRTGAAMWNVLTLLAVFALARRMHSPGAGLAAAAAFALASTAPAIEGFTANAELFAALPLALAAWATWREKWLTAAAFAAAATLIKPIGLSGWLLAAAWLAWRRAGWKPLILMSLVYAAGPALSALHGAAVSWEGYWNSMVRDSLLAFQGVRQTPGEQLQNFIRRGGHALPALALLLPAALYALRVMDGRRRIFVGFSIAAALCGMAIGGRWYWHYFIQIVPVLAVPAGIGLVACVKSRVGWAAGGLTVAALVYFVISQGNLWLLDGPRASYEIYHRSPYVSNEETAAFIRQNTRPDDTIYVAFSQAELYYLADRMPAVPRHLFWSQIAASRDVFDEVIAAIRGGKPKYVILERESPRWMPHAQFIEILEQRYEPVRRFAGVIICERVR